MYERIITIHFFIRFLEAHMFLRLVAIGACTLLAGCNTRSGEPGGRLINQFNQRMAQACGPEDRTPQYRDCWTRNSEPIRDIVLSETRANRPPER